MQAADLDPLCAPFESGERYRLGLLDYGVARRVLRDDPAIGNLVATCQEFYPRRLLYYRLIDLAQLADLEAAVARNQDGALMIYLWVLLQTEPDLAVYAAKRVLDAPICEGGWSRVFAGQVSLGTLSVPQ